jgi:hypothetical protein
VKPNESSDACVMLERGICEAEKFKPEDGGDTFIRNVG